MEGYSKNGKRNKISKALITQYQRHQDKFKDIFRKDLKISLVNYAHER